MNEAFNVKIHRMNIIQMKFLFYFSGEAIKKVSKGSLPIRRERRTKEKCYFHD